MKKLVLLAAACLLALSLAGCTRTCKEKDCDKEVYKEGYCQYHYTMNELKNVGESIADVFTK